MKRFSAIMVSHRITGRSCSATARSNVIAVGRFFLSTALMKMIYHSFTIVTYYSAFGILFETKFSDCKCMSIQCVRSQTLVLLELASCHWK